MGLSLPGLRMRMIIFFQLCGQILRSLNERDPDYPPLQLHSARLNKVQKNYKVMKIYLDKAISLESNYFGALHLLGEYYL